MIVLVIRQEHSLKILSVCSCSSSARFLWLTVCHMSSEDAAENMNSLCAFWEAFFSFPSLYRIAKLRLFFFFEVVFLNGCSNHPLSDVQ